MSDALASLRRSAQATWAVALREFRKKYGGRRLGVFWAFAEPIGYIIVFTFILAALRQRTSPIGGEVAPFLAEGLFGFMLFMKVEREVRSGTKGNDGLLAFPRIRPITIYAGKVLSVVATVLIVFVGLYGTFIVIGMAEFPAQPDRLIAASTITIALGFSVGLINAMLISITPAWGSVYGILSRGNLFLSGVFFIAESLPIHVRNILYYHPLLHINEWVRSACHNNFESRFVDVNYVLWFTAVSLFLALLFERVLRNQMLND